VLAASIASRSEQSGSQVPSFVSAVLVTGNVVAKGLAGRKTSARINAYRSAVIAEAPTSLELCPFSLAVPGSGKRNLTQNVTRTVIIINPVCARLPIAAFCPSRSRNEAESLRIWPRSVSYFLVLLDTSAHNNVLHRPLTDSSWEADADGVFDHRANALRGSISGFGWGEA
jgi:hypothetical protein